MYFPLAFRIAVHTTRSQTFASVASVGVMPGVTIGRPPMRLASGGVATKRPFCDASHSSPFHPLLGVFAAFARRECAVVQILSIVAIGSGLAASAAWTGFLGFELFRVVGLMF